MEELKRLRRQRGWSQAKLAIEAGLDPSTVNQIETGARHPNTKTLEKLANVLEVEFADLFPKAEAPLPLDLGAEAAGQPAEWSKVRSIESVGQRSFHGSALEGKGQQALHYSQPWRVIHEIADTWEVYLEANVNTSRSAPLDGASKEVFGAGWLMGTYTAYTNVAVLVARDLLETVERPGKDVYDSEELEEMAAGIRRVAQIALRVKEKARATIEDPGDREEMLEAPYRRLAEVVSRVA